MKTKLQIGLLVALTSSLYAQSPTPINNNPPTVNFDKTKDLFVAQFDSKPDPDDIQAIAAVGCMLAHPDLHNIDFYGVQGTVGLQGWFGKNGNNNRFIEATNLMNLAFGQGRWTQAGNGLRNSFPNNSNYSDFSPANTNWTASVTRVRDKARAAINRGGKVYVMEAGNSDFTHDWVQALQSSGVSAASTRANIVVVQHSNWNENQTTTTNRVGANGNETIPANRTQVLNWVRNNTDYRRIADGNGNNATPAYNTNQTQWAFSAENSNNPNSHARALWIAAENTMNTVFSRNPSTYPSYSNIRFRGAVDFSDTCEAWYIFNVGNNANTIAKFWSRYVRNTNSANGPVPRNFGGGGGGAPINQTVAFKASGNGQYVASDRNLDAVNWPLVANRPNVGGSWERFKIMNAGGGKISIQATGNNQFVSADFFLDNVNWRLAANRPSVGGWEKFTWISNSDGTVSLRAQGNNQVVASDRNLNATNWPLAANRPNVGGSWEKFTVQNQ